MNIMREGEEFYIEESSGVLAALLVEIARLNRASPGRQGGKRKTGETLQI